MGKLIVIVAFLLCLSVGPAMAANSLVINGDFDDQTGTPWFGTADSIQYVNDTINGDTICSIGWWWYDWIMQDTGVVFQADSVYTMTIQARDGDGNAQGNDPSMSISIHDMNEGESLLTLASVAYKFQLTTWGDGAPWEEVTLTFDTATNPGIVGHKVGVGITAYNEPTAAWIQIDSVELMVLPAPPDNPSPPDDADPGDDVGEVGVFNGSKVDVLLEWDTALDPNGDVDKNITKHYIYLQENDPNFLGASPYATISAGDPVDPRPSYSATDLNLNSIYYWKVAESLYDSEYDEPNTFGGYTWAFETIPEVVAITDEPNDILVAPGGTAVFEVSATSVTAIAYNWYISIDKVADPGGADPLIGSGSGRLEYPVDPNDAGKFVFCVLTNGAGDVYSRMALLEVYRLMAHWMLNDNMDDSSGNGWTGSIRDPNIFDAITPAPDYDAGIDDSAMKFFGDGEFMQVGSSEEVFNNYHLGLTASVWVKTSAESGWYIVAGKQDRSAEGEPGCSLNISPDGSPQMVIIGVPSVTANTSVTDDAWHQVTATFDGSVIKIYIDGEYDNESAVAAFIPELNSQPVEVGGQSSTADEYRYPGLADDIQLYNYAISDIQVLDLYNAFIDPDKVLCILEYSSAADISGPLGVPDCLVDLYDVAALAGGWLSCGLYPLCP